MCIRDRVGKAALVVLGIALSLAPWSLRNHGAFGSFSPLPTNGGIVLHQAYNAQNPASAIWIPAFVNYLNPSEIWRGYAAEAERRVGQPLTPPQVDGYWPVSYTHLSNVERSAVPIPHSSPKPSHANFRSERHTASAPATHQVK